MKRIVVAIDGSEPSWRALDHAVGLLRGESELVLLNVLRDDQVQLDDLNAFARAEGIEAPPIEVLRIFATKLLERARGRALRAGARLVSVVLAEGEPSASILEFARDHCADLIVLGNRGRNRMAAALLGSISQKVVSEAVCPVTVVH